MTIDNCNLCGLCNEICSVTNATKKESTSPRAKMLLIKKNILDKAFYVCADPLEYNASCNKGVDIYKEIMRMRQLMVEKGMETKANKEMIENLRRTGNPFGLVMRKPEVKEELITNVQTQRA